MSNTRYVLAKLVTNPTPPFGKSNFALCPGRKSRIKLDDTVATYDGMIALLKEVFNIADSNALRLFLFTEDEESGETSAVLIQARKTFDDEILFFRDNGSLTTIDLYAEEVASPSMAFAVVTVAAAPDEARAAAAIASDAAPAQPAQPKSGNSKRQKTADEEEPERESPDVPKYLQSGCAALADTFCQSYIGTGSHCKSYKTDECGRSRSGWSGKVLLQPDLTTNDVCDVGGAGCGGDIVCAVSTCFETLRRVLGETFAASVDGVLLENESAASPALKACSTGEVPSRAACLDAFHSHSGASDWEVWSIADFTAYGSAGYAAVPRFAQFYNMYSRGDGGSFPCVKCGPSPGCQLDFEAWRAQPACEDSALLPQFGGAICFQDAARSVGCAHACGRDVPCLTQADAATSTAFGGGIYDPALNISPAAIGEYLGGIYTSGGVHRRPTAAESAAAVATLPFTTASQPSLVAKIRNAADVEELAAGMLSAFAAARASYVCRRATFAQRVHYGAGASQPLRIAAWGAPCWLINSTARARVAPCAGI